MYKRKEVAILNTSIKMVSTLKQGHVVLQSYLNQQQMYFSTMLFTNQLMPTSSTLINPYYFPFDEPHFMPEFFMMMDGSQEMARQQNNEVIIKSENHDQQIIQMPPNDSIAIGGQMQVRVKRKYRKRRNHLAKFECDEEGCYSLFSSQGSYSNHQRKVHRKSSKRNFSHL